MRVLRITYTGFSILEFMVALILCAIGALFMAPLYYKVVFSYEATAYTNNLVATLNYARSQALRRSLPVSVCSSDDGRRCADKSWSNGYIVFVDGGLPGVMETGDLVLKSTVSRNPRITVTLTGGRYVRFNPSGSLMASASMMTPLSDERYISDLGRWLRRLSPIAIAQAADPLDGYREDASEKIFSARDAVTQGTFTVCIKHVGRTVKLSLTGHIKTAVARCS